MAFAYLLTVRGTPMIYYGDEIGMRGGEDPDNRRDFPGGWKEDARNAFEASGRTAEEQDIWSYVQKLLALRAKTEALRNGKLTDLALTEKTWAYARGGDAVIVMNNGSGAADVLVPFTDGVYAGQLWGGELKVSDGLGTAHLAGHSAEVFLRVQAVKK